jgi:hypothetical protein
MNVLLVHCMIMVLIGLAFAVMAFLLFRVALLTSPTEKPGRNLLRALPGILFAAFSMYIIHGAANDLPTSSPPSNPAEALLQQPNSGGLPLVVGRVVLTGLPKFAFMPSNGSGMVELNALATTQSSDDPGEEEAKVEEQPTPAKKLVPVEEKQPWRPKVVSADQAASHGGTP